jgi:hypothetical protein
MIAVDTSTWIAFLEGDGGEDVELLDRALQDRQVLMAPVVLTAVLSNPKLSSEVSQTLSELPLIEVGPGYWQRAGELRAKVIPRPAKRCDNGGSVRSIDIGIATYFTSIHSHFHGFGVRSPLQAFDALLVTIEPSFVRFRHQQQAGDAFHDLAQALVTFLILRCHLTIISRQ